MAEFVISPLVELLLGKLVSITEQEISLVSGVDQELNKLSSTLSIIEDLLVDAEEKQVTERAVRNWLNKLKDVAYDADDILDEYATETLRFKVKEGTAHNHHPSSQVCNFSFFLPSFCINKVKFRRNIGHKIKEIRERLDGINKERSDFNIQLERRSVSERRFLVESNRNTGPYVDESTVIGRDAEKERIIDLLLSSRYDDRSIGGFCVIPIVGFGGLGKTTLAQCVFNENKRGKEHFDLKMWVCVSTEFEIERLIKAIIGEASCNSLDLVGLQHRLHEKLTGKRYMLVLDDVWNEDHETWERLWTLLRCGGSGSRIIVTTRSIRVSSIMQTIDPIHLEGLSEVDSWTLFARRAFRDEGEQEIYLQLVEIGKKIVEKCRGVPLAIKTLGALLYREREKREWSIVLQSRMLDIPEDKNNILNALRLSYNYLPSYLKPCFALCSIFPKDYRINKNKLIRIWMAQGYIIQPSNESKQMEDVGSDYFKYLLHGCFFQEVKEDDYGNIKSCKMHDLFHDLAQSVAGNECQMIDDGRSMGTSNKVLHLSFTNDSTIPPYECYRLRTILPLGTKRLKVEKRLFMKFKCLRVLDLSNCGITMLPNSIGNLKHLRYFNISCNDFNTLPESICSLWNLQTLKITRCENLSKLPKDMKNMINLRHLEIDTDGNQLSFMPVEIGKLTCLQTLPIFPVGEGGASIRELGWLKSLRGDLNIYNLANVKNMEDAKEELLKDKEYLYSLNIRWNGRVDDVVSGQHEEVHEVVLESLKPHTNLKHLHIDAFNGAKFPEWVSDSSFRDLVKVRLESCNSCQHLPPFGQLQSLKNLTIYQAHGVKAIDDKFYGVGNVKRFPSLESLSLDDFPNLEEWSTNDCQGDMCCLTDLRIERCPKLRALPNLPSLQRLEFDGECKITSSRQGLEHLTTLKTLKFFKCDDIALTLEHHPSLETLEINDCGHLTSIHNGLFQNLFTLTSLEIDNCTELKPLPETMQNLAALRNLTIDKSTNFVSSPHAFKHLTALKSLSIYSCIELESLPGELQYLTALKSLSIYYCEELESLPGELQYLTALDSVRIEWCEKLGCLPEGLKYLTTLQDLFIRGCPLLVERCRSGGEDWHKISHIPNISVRPK